LLTARSSRFDALERNTQQQFGGFGGTVGGGITIPIFGSGGFVGGIRGGLIPGGFQARGGSGIGPVLTLESAFGVGFTAQSVADAIRVAEQSGRFTGEGPVTGAITIATGPELTLVLNLARGLFELFNASGQKVGGGVTPEAAIEAARAGAPPPLPEGAVSEPPTFPPTLGTVTTAPFVEPPQPPATIATPENLRFFLGLVSDLFRRGDDPLGTPPATPPIPSFPPFPTPNIPPPLPPGPPRVEVGGTVNVPVVLGSTGDPTGIRRPRFPDEDQLSRAQQIGLIIRNLLALRKARQNADKQRRAFEQFLAARLELLRGAQMPFGQAGFVGTGLLGPGVGGFLGGLAADAAEALIGRIGGGGGGAITSLPAFPPGIPGLAGGAPFLGGGGGCPPLFRTGAPAGFSMRPVPWFPVQAPNGKWFFFGHLGRPTFSKLKSPRRHHHHRRLR